MTSFDHLTSRAALAGLFVLLGACGGDDAAVKPTNTLDAGLLQVADASANVDADDDDDSDEDDVPCTPDFPDFTPGMTSVTTVSDLTIKLLAIDPSPPRQLVPNNWTVQLMHADQTPATDAVVSTPLSYMPVHRHYGLTTPVVQTSTTPGQVGINQINFRMRGPWQVSFNVTPDGGTPKIATFQICVQ